MALLKAFRGSSLATLKLSGFTSFDYDRESESSALRFELSSVEVLDLQYDGDDVEGNFLTVVSPRDTRPHSLLSLTTRRRVSRIA